MIIMIVFVMTKLMEIELVITDIVNDIARIIDNSLDNYECGIFGRDYNDSECNDETKAD